MDVDVRSADLAMADAMSAGPRGGGRRERTLIWLFATYPVNGSGLRAHRADTAHVCARARRADARDEKCVGCREVLTTVVCSSWYSSWYLSCLVLFRTGPGAPHHVVSRGSDPAYHGSFGTVN